MIIYQSTKKDFIDQLQAGGIEFAIGNFYFKSTGKHVNASEQESWKKSMRFMRDVLRDSEIPEDSGVAIEYQIPLSTKRVDFILTGQNGDGVEHVVLIELKQWSKVQLTEKDGVVDTDFFGEVSHPSYQVWTYASLIEGFCETVEKDHIHLKPCAYLHNYIEDDVIKNPFYSEYTKKAPVFLEGDEEKEKLQAFIKRFVKHGDKKRLMYRIDHSRIKPSKALADSLASMLKGNQEFLMIDDQKVVFETAKFLMKKSDLGQKNVLIVEGGPGTGKSVVAINLLVEFTKAEIATQYVTRNAAPRAVYEALLSGNFKKSHISNLFSGSGAFIDLEKDAFGALIVDEAHRLNQKSGMYKNLGENQIKELIEAAKFSVFFLDEDQKVTWQDIGEKEEIRKWAARGGAQVHLMKLTSQFRCSGSDGYLAWLDDVLQIRETANSCLGESGYDFQVVESPNILREMIFEKNKEKNKARLVAGYCWDWVSKKDKNKKDIVIPEFDFGMRWNLSTDGSLWIMSPSSVNEVGCIHTCQGLETDYVGVIVGSDFVVRDGKVITQPERRSKMDASLKGFKKELAIHPLEARRKADAIIKNTYRTLMTRGMKGCYVYFTDKETENYFRGKM